MLRTTVVIAILTLFHATAAFPQAATTEGKIGRALHQSLTPENRAELAQLFGTYCREVLDSIPTNTPDEDAWVMSESKAPFDAQRTVRLTSSKEWARHRLVETFSECLQEVASLRQAQAQNSRTAEARYFISLAETFEGIEDFGEFAKRVGVRSEHSISKESLTLLRQELLLVAMRTLDGRTDPVIR